MSDPVNYGISGVQNLNAENIAVGTNSKVEQIKLAPMEEQLDALRRAIDGFDGPPGSREELSAAHAEIVEELRAPAPQKDRILSKLAWMREVAESAGPVLQAVTALANVVMLAL